jgi:hypothetical protein
MDLVHAPKISIKGQKYSKFTDSFLFILLFSRKKGTAAITVMWHVLPGSSAIFGNAIRMQLCISNNLRLTFSLRGYILFVSNGLFVAGGYKL